ncbi:hypothetical protein [Foetidibacter luteolus]|uniref:hypothetical protein n=1 Tax=Foetidibacter luteolus TaxID=2608880 RepID=UPI00129A457E|nr:hypothetical protein [Foetidibacter luteolus]
MSYKTSERDSAILLIGAGIVSDGSLHLYEELEKFNWVYIERVNGKFKGITLTYSGKELFRILTGKDSSHNS